jgi:hypothetical protein
MLNKITNKGLKIRHVWSYYFNFKVFYIEMEVGKNLKKHQNFISDFLLYLFLFRNLA